MAFEDYMEPEVAVAAVVTAAIFSPRARKIIRQGAVYGMAGLLVAGDTLSSLVRNVGQGFQEGAAKAQAGQQPRVDSDMETEAVHVNLKKGVASKGAHEKTKVSAETAGG